MLNHNSYRLVQDQRHDTVVDYSIVDDIAVDGKRTSLDPDTFVAASMRWLMRHVASLCRRYAREIMGLSSQNKAPPMARAIRCGLSLMTASGLGERRRPLNTMFRTTTYLAL
jgi:hypothetical protein